MPDTDVQTVAVDTKSTVADAKAPVPDRLNLAKVMREDGVGDLPLAIRGPFIHALIEERKGNDALASEYLNKAVDADIQWHKDNPGVITYPTK